MSNASVVGQAALDPLTDLIFGSILILFSVVATIGNATVIFVFMKESILRTTTNYFLMSLAFSDLLVGILVMPFGIIERFNYGRWLFGRDLCDIWHAVDVMSCTASIMNLCFIAIERYQAIHDPIKHPLRPNKRRVYMGILLAWMCSAVISFPAIAWWRISDTQKYATQHNKSIELVSMNDLSAEVCEFTDSSEYLISSAMVSFYVPTACMLVLYYRIYRTAINVSRSLVTGERSVAVAQTGCAHENLRYGSSFGTSGGGGGSGSGGGRDSLVLRVHRGKTIRHGKESVTTQPLLTVGNNSRTTQICPHLSVRQRSTDLSGQTQVENDFGRLSLPNGNGNGNANGGAEANGSGCEGNKVMTHHPSVSSQEGDNVNQDLLADSSKPNKTGMANIQSMALSTIVDIAGRTSAQSTRLRVVKKLQGFVTLKQQLRRFAREQKAAKTLGLIISLFIACWGPFFLCSLLIALQQLDLIGEIIPQESLPLVSLCVTWLGYANSCINCFAYPWAMRDFRRAIYKHVKFPLSKCLRFPFSTLRNRSSSFITTQRSTDRTIACTQTGFGQRSAASSVRCKNHPIVLPDPLSSPDAAAVGPKRNGYCTVTARDEVSRFAKSGCFSSELQQCGEKEVADCKKEGCHSENTEAEAEAGVCALRTRLLQERDAECQESQSRSTFATKPQCSAAELTVALPYSSDDIPHRLLVEVLSMNGSLV